MCLVIDTSCLAKVLDINNRQHYRFEPVHKWITKGRGSVVFGGTKYKRELKNVPKYLGVLAELNRQGRVIQLSDPQVNRIAEEVSKTVNRNDFDDEHLIAIVRVACCVVVCTDDARAVPYLKRADLYPGGVKRPKIYKHAGHRVMCSNQNIVGVCKKRLDQRR